VDETKQFKPVSILSLVITTGLLGLLGLAFGYDAVFSSPVVIGALMALGFFVGPLQPINAELAVEVAYPCDENAVEATQQLSGNLFSALLVPACQSASSFDIELIKRSAENTPLETLVPEDLRGDTLILILLSLSALVYYVSFNAPLKREMFDNQIIEKIRMVMVTGEDGEQEGGLSLGKSKLNDDFRAIFDSIDRDDSGDIDLSEFLRFLDRLGPCAVKTTKSQPSVLHMIADLWDSLDADGNGTLSYDELESWYMDLQRV